MFVAVILVQSKKNLLIPSDWIRGFDIFFHLNNGIHGSLSQRRHIVFYSPNVEKSLGLPGAFSKTRCQQPMLETWQQACLEGKNPQKIIMDNSAALLLACANAFAHCDSMIDYDNKCYDALLRGGDPPQTFASIGHTPSKVLCEWRRTWTETRQDFLFESLDFCSSMTILM